MTTKRDITDYMFYLRSSDDNTLNVNLEGHHGQISQLLVDLHELNIDSVTANNGKKPSIVVDTPHSLSVLTKIADFCRRFNETPFEPLQRQDMMSPIWEHASERSSRSHMGDTLPKIPQNIIDSPLIRDLCISDLITRIYASEKHDSEIYPQNPDEEPQFGEQSESLRANEGPWIQYARYFQIDILENLLEYFIYYFLEKLTPSAVCDLARIPFTYALDMPGVGEIMQPQGERPFYSFQ